MTLLLVAGTLLLFLATCGLVWVGRRQVGWMRQHAKHLEELAEQTKEIAGAARDSADAAIESANASRRAVDEAHRAWFSIEPKATVHGADMFYVTVAFRNQGLVRARVTKVFGHCEGPGGQLPVANLERVVSFQMEDRRDEVPPGGSVTLAMRAVVIKARPAWGYFGIEYEDGVSMLPCQTKRSFVVPEGDSMAWHENWRHEPVENWDRDR